MSTMTLTLGRPTESAEARLGLPASQEEVERVVVGLPRQMNNTPSESMRYIEPFVSRFQQRFPHIPVVYFDERFTSSLAHRAMLDGGLKKKDRQNKALVDEISATIILQSYLESKQYKEQL